MGGGGERGGEGEGFNFIGERLRRFLFKKKIAGIYLLRRMKKKKKKGEGNLVCDGAFPLF